MEREDRLAYHGWLGMAVDETKTQTTLLDRPEATLPDANGSESALLDGVELVQGTTVGRYLVLRKVGAGGMGVVYEAYDPKLDRRIALKLLRVRERKTLSDVRARERLLREAQAIAQLTHPNVVTAYDVGTYGDSVFVAMELVKGGTLKEWINNGERPVRDILAVLIAAGRGIAAAHEAGLVHRDIKPANVLVGDDGQVRIVDFGLARTAALVDSASDGETPDTEEAAFERPDTVAGLVDSGDHWLSSPVTVVGALVGTPGYVAPEQYKGEPLGESSDQFGFCATMYYALYGKRAFVGRTPRELQKAVIAGDVVPPPKDTKVPARVRRIIYRGLSPSPEDRYGSMNELLAELGADPRARLRKVGLGVGVAALAVSTIVLSMRAPAQERTCRVDRSVLAGTWDDAVRREMTAAFAATGVSRSARIAATVGRALDDRTARWQAMRLQACEATHVYNTQSQRLLDLRIQCLDRRLGEMRALTTLLRSRPDKALIENATRSVYDLRSFSRCSDARALAEVVAPPESADARRKVRAGFQQVAQARAYLIAAKYDDGLHVARAAVAEARTLAYAPLLAQALHVQGYLQAKAGAGSSARATLQRAAVAAARARDDRLLAKIALDVVYVVGNLERAYEPALTALRLAEAAVERAGAPPELRADWLTNLGFLLDRTGDSAGATTALTEALTLWQSSLGARHPNVAHTLNQLGIVAGTSGDPVAGSRYMRRALDIWRETLGDDHPKVGVAYNNLGQSEFDQGNYTSALAHFERARTLYAARLGPDHPKVGIATLNISGVLAKQHKCTDAERSARRALSIFETQLGKGHPYVAYALIQIAECQLQDGRVQESLPLLRRARRIRTPLAKAKVGLGQVCFLLAKALWRADGSRVAARKAARDARAAYLAGGRMGVAPLVEVDRWLASHAAP